VGEYLAWIEPILKDVSVRLARLQEDVDKTLHCGAEDLQVWGRKMEPSVAEAKRLVDAALEKFGQAKKAEVPQTRASLAAELGQIMQQVLASITSFHSFGKELGEMRDAQINAIKDEAMQVLRQLGYSAIEARKAVDAVWERYGPLETAADVVKKVFEKGPPRR
jgi:ribosomal protein L7/L12